MLISSTGLGFAVRNELQQDVEDDIDVDGEDEAVYGAAQFTQIDVLGTSGTVSAEDEEVQVDDEDDGVHRSPRASGSAGPSTSPRTSQHLVAEGQAVHKVSSNDALLEVKKTMDEVMGVGETEELNKTVDLARKSGKASALIEALERKIKSLVSRVGASHKLYR